MAECAHTEYKANKLRAAAGFRPGWAAIAVPLIGWSLLELADAYSNARIYRGQSALELWLPIILTLLVLHFALTAFSNRKRAIRLTFTDRGIGIQTIFVGRREISGDDIREIKYLRFTRALVIRTYLDDFIVGKEIKGFDAVCERFAAMANQGLIGGTVLLPKRKKKEKKKTDGESITIDVVPKLKLAPSELQQTERGCTHNQFRANAIWVFLSSQDNALLILLALTAYLCLAFFSMQSLIFSLHRNFLAEVVLLAGLIVIPLGGVMLARNAWSCRKRAVQVIFTDNGIAIQTLLCGRQEIPWHTIREIKYMRFPRALVIKTYLDSYAIGREIIGFDELCMELSAIAKQELTAASVEIPYKDFGYHTLVVPLVTRDKRQETRDVNASGTWSEVHDP